LAISGVVALVTLGIYLAIGRPELQGASYQTRLEALKGRDPTTYNVDEALAILAEAAKDNLRDPLPHLFSGQLLLDQRRPQEAARSFDAALRRDPGSGEAMLGLGRAMVGAEGRVTPEALALFHQAGALTDDPAPWLYQARAAVEADNEPEARRFWNEALSRMAADDPLRQMPMFATGP
jgi:cytochrome c-type biogenesis protein CcmH/NrfG